MKVKKIEDFYPLLANKVEVQEALEDYFGANYSLVLKKLKSGSPLNEEELHAETIIDELVINEYEIVNTASSIGSDSEFFYDICKYGPVYFISAPEFDNIGYFTTIEGAIEEADHEYSPFFENDEESE